LTAGVTKKIKSRPGLVQQSMQRDFGCLSDFFYRKEGLSGEFFEKQGPGKLSHFYGIPKNSLGFPVIFC
jgi:hypothetical protein